MITMGSTRVCLGSRLKSLNRLMLFLEFLVGFIAGRSGWDAVGWDGCAFNFSPGCFKGWSVGRGCARSIRFDDAQVSVASVVAF